MRTHDDRARNVCCTRMLYGSNIVVEFKYIEIVSRIEIEPEERVRRIMLVG